MSKYMWDITSGLAMLAFTAAIFCADLLYK